jgi:hypothetical protein
VPDAPEPVYATATVSLMGALALSPAEADRMPADALAILASLRRLAGPGDSEPGE